MKLYTLMVMKVIKDQTYSHLYTSFIILFTVKIQSKCSCIYSKKNLAIF